MPCIAWPAALLIKQVYVNSIYFFQSVTGQNDLLKKHFFYAPVSKYNFLSHWVENWLPCTLLTQVKSCCCAQLSRDKRAKIIMFVSIQPLEINSALSKSRWLSFNMWQDEFSVFLWPEDLLLQGYYEQNLNVGH